MGTFFSKKTRLTNHYVPLQASLPQMIRQTLVEMFLWACKTNCEKVLRDPIFRGGGMARNSISKDLFQHGNESLHAPHYIIIITSLHAPLPQMLSQTLSEKKIIKVD